MQLPTRFIVHDSRRQISATALIGVGLLTLIVSAFWPSAPVVTAMAIIALGATGVTLARFQGNAALLTIVILHSLTYATLYAVFIGATLNSTHQHSASNFAIWNTLDLTLSVFPMVVLLRRIYHALCQSRLSRP